MTTLKPKNLSVETILLLEGMIRNDWELPDNAESFSKEIHVMISTSESLEQLSLLKELLEVDFTTIQLLVNDITK